MPFVFVAAVFVFPALFWVPLGIGLLLMWQTWALIGAVIGYFLLAERLPRFHRGLGTAVEFVFMLLVYWPLYALWRCRSWRSIGRWSDERQARRVARTPA